MERKTTLQRAAAPLNVLVVCDDKTLAGRIEQSLCADTPVPPNARKLSIAPPDTAAPDVLVIEVGGYAGLDLFRTCREQYPSVALVVCAREADAELAEVATENGAHDVLYIEEADPAVVRRTLAYAVERHDLIRRLLAARHRETELATHDSVTGLANRSLLFTFTDQAIAFSKRRRAKLAIAVFDIRSFRSTNERFGYRVGDKLLSVVAERMSDAIRSSDMVGRLGGDEYIVLFRDISSTSEASKAIAKLSREVARPLYVAGHKLSVETRAGVAFYPADGEDAETLVAGAYQALLTAKTDGSGYRCASSSDAFAAG